MLELACLFRKGMVLQREKMISIWGNTDPGMTVSVSIQGQTVCTNADGNGMWLVRLNPLAVSFREIMTIVSGTQTIVIEDVQVGEVWLAGGQSNMEFHMRYDADYATEKAECTNDSIRFFDYPEVSYVGQVNDADYGKHYAFWRKATAEDLERFSAVGYYFAKDLHQRYQVPVGIIGCNWGGTPACAWMSEAAVRAGGGQIYLDEYAAAVRDLNMEEYDRKFFAAPTSFNTDLLANPINDMMMMGCSIEQIGAKLLEMGIDLTQITTDFQPAIGPRYERRPCGLYESMLKPLAPYGIRGVIWYQGETDGDSHPELYRTLFPALIDDWRSLWGEDLPFLFVQIAPLERWMQCVGEPYAIIRDAQQHTAYTVPMTAMAVTSDVGMRNDIHPKKKQPVGHRLALLAESKVYGDDVLCEAPTLVDVECQEGKVVLRFDNAGDGLYLAENTPCGEKLPDKRFCGVEIEQDGIQIDSSALNAAVDGDKVVLTGSVIGKNGSTVVRIAQGGWFQVNLYNSAGIPARPVVCDSLQNHTKRTAAS